MKKFLILGLGVIGALSIVSCDNKAASKCQGGDEEILYTAIVPGADNMGTVYSLAMDYDHDDNDGDYLLVENTLVSDSLAATGFTSSTTSLTKGDFKKLSKTVDGAVVEYIQLVPDAKDALGAPSAGSGFFVINQDGSLTMVAEDLVIPADTAAYTFKPVK